MLVHVSQLSPNWHKASRNQSKSVVVQRVCNTGNTVSVRMAGSAPTTARSHNHKLHGSLEAATQDDFASAVHFQVPRCASHESNHDIELIQSTEKKEETDRVEKETHTYTHTERETAYD